MAQVIDSDVVFDGKLGHNTYHTNIADMEGLMCQALAQMAGTVSSSNGVNIAAIQSFVSNGFLLSGLSPSGDVTGATDTTNIQGLLNLGAGKTVVLGAGKFLTNGPVIPPPYTTLVGQPSSSQVTQTDEGTVIAPVGGFVGKTITDSGSVLLNGAIVMLGQSFGGYATVTEEIHVRNIMIDCTSAPGSVTGIISYGKVQRVHLSEVLISKTTADGVQHNLDVAGNQPDAWYGYKVFSRFCTGKGFNLRSADSTWTLCLGSNNGDASCDWFINTTSNSKYIGCRSEHSTAGLGFGYVCRNNTSASGGVEFIGCSTDQSFKHGFQAGGTINGVASFAKSTPISLTGCRFRRDGANGGSGGGGYAGFYDADYGGVITVTGLIVAPGVNDDGSGTNAPQIGALFDSGSTAVISASYIQGATTAITDNSGGTVNYDNSVVTATGTTSSPTVSMSPNIAVYQGAAINITPAAAPSSDPIQVTNVNAAERSIGVLVSGDSFDRIKITSDGKINFGSGALTQDCVFGRMSAGVFGATTGSLAVDVAGQGFQVKEGSNAKQGTAVLNGTTEVIVANSSVTASSRIFLTINVPGGTPGSPYVSSRSAGVQFGIKSTGASDSSTVAYEIFEPAP